jgi:hypothetical protein
VLPNYSVVGVRLGFALASPRPFAAASHAERTRLGQHRKLGNPQGNRNS